MNNLKNMFKKFVVTVLVVGSMAQLSAAAGPGTAGAQGPVTIQVPVNAPVPPGCQIASAVAGQVTSGPMGITVPVTVTYGPASGAVGGPAAGGPAGR